MLRPTFGLSSCVRPVMAGLMAIGLGACLGDEAPDTSTSAGKPATRNVAAEQKPAIAAKPAGPQLRPLPQGLSGGGLKRPELTDGKSHLLNRALFGRSYGVGESQPARIAMLVPFSGPVAPVGKALFQAAQLALFDANDVRITLMPKDTKGTEIGAVQAAREAISHGAQVIVGPLFGKLIDAVRAEAKLAGIPVISFSNDRQRAGDGVYTLGLPPEAEVARMMGHAVRDGHVKIAALLPDSGYGRRVSEALFEAASTHAVDMTRIEFYPAGATADNAELLAAAKRVADYDRRRGNLKAEVNRLKKRSDPVARATLRRLENQDTLGNPPFTAIFLAERANRLPSVAPLLPYYDVNPANVRFLGLGNWYASGLGREPALVGGRFPMPDLQMLSEFNRRYTATFGVTAPRIAPLGYEAVALVAALMQDAVQGNGVVFTAETLTNKNGFRAYSGPFRLLESGYAERNLGVIEVKAGGLQVVEPPRTDFNPLVN